MTLSVGASLFDDRYGLAAAKPARLRTMEDFPNDALRREVCDGDLLLQVCADDRDTVTHAVREIDAGDARAGCRCAGGRTGSCRRPAHPEPRAT